jgi:SDR family mycofactocin-dependent oxidoreductase
MNDLTAKTALITGAAHGQGRAHALTMAACGADVVLCDIGEEIETTPYPAGTMEELEETRQGVEALGRGCVALQADTRSAEDMRRVVEAGLEAFGKIDIAVANAGILSTAPAWDVTDEQFDELMSINVKGVWQTVKAVGRHMVDRQQGSIVLTASINGMVPYANMCHYVASKHGVLGLMKGMAVDFGPHSVRVNAVCPTTVPTAMVMPSLPYFAPDVEEPTLDDIAPHLKVFHLLPQPWVEAEDISKAVVFLASDDARFVTGVALPVSLGAHIQPPGYPVAAGLDLSFYPSLRSGEKDMQNLNDPRLAELAQERELTEEERTNVATVERLVKYFNEGDIENFVRTTYHPDYRMVVLDGVAWNGHAEDDANVFADIDEFIAMEAMIHDVVPRRRFEINRIIPAGNVVTFQASLVDDARPGGELPWCSVYTFKDGLIIADSAYLNHYEWPGTAEAMEESRPDQYERERDAQG